MLSVKNKGSNYLAQVVRLSGIRKHSNADRLQCVNIQGNNVITGLDAKDGLLYVYFPLECKINSNFLSHTNSFRDKDLNKNPEIAGMFDSSGRTKALKLRGEKSEGYIVPVGVIQNWFREVHSTEIDLSKFIDMEFDTIANILLCEKYVVNRRNQGAENSQKQKKRDTRKKFTKLISEQYELAEDTSHLKKNIHKISPEDNITIAYKMHGCNISMGKVLCNKQLKWYEKLLKKIGVNIVDTEYDVIYASRRVIKNQYVYNDTQHYYDVDIWGEVCNKYKNALQDGITIHGEIVGQLSNGKYIQSNYDYGVGNGNAELFVYRMFYKTPSGKTIEFNTEQMVAYCAAHGIKTVPIFYNGKAKDLFNLNVTEHWHQNFLQKLVETYNEKDCFMCKNKVPEEGICLILNSKNAFEAFKLKSFRFLQHESEELDKGESNIEDDA